MTLEQLSPHDDATQDAIAAAISDMFLVEGSPGGNLYPSQFYAAIDAIPGINHYIMTVPDPTEQVNVPNGALPVMGRLTVL